MESFKLSNGYELPIVKGFREQIKPNWKKAYKNFEYDPIPIEKTSHARKSLVDHSSLILKSFMCFFLSLVY